MLHCFLWFFIEMYFKNKQSKTNTFKYKFSLYKYKHKVKKKFVFFFYFFISTNFFVLDFFLVVEMSK